MTLNSIPIRGLISPNNIRVHNRTRNLIFRYRNVSIPTGSSIVLENNRINSFTVWHPAFQLNISVSVTISEESVRWHCDSMAIVFIVVDDGIIIEDTIRLPSGTML